MVQGPIHITLLAVSLALTVALAWALGRKPEPASLRVALLAGLCGSLAHEGAGLFLLPGPGGRAWAGAYLGLEVAGAMAWLFFGRRYAREPGEAGTPVPPWAWMAAGAALLGALSAAPGFLVRPGAEGMAPALAGPGIALRLATLGLLLAALTSLETTLVNSIHGQRWRIKFTILGAFAILIAQLFTVSLEVLYRALDLNLAMARQTGFVLGASMMLYSVLFRGGESPITISRRLARSSVVLFGAGAYLVFLGALGFVMGLTGSTGNTAALLAVGLVAGMAVVVLLLSEEVRRKCNRLLQHYFYKEKYDYRVQWLSFTKRLSRAGSVGDLHRAVLLGFSETFGMGGAVLYLKDPDAAAMLPARAWEIDQPVPPLADWTFLERAVARGSTALRLQDLDEGIDEPSLAFFREIRAAFAVPLIFERAPVGMVLLARPIDPSEDYTQEDVDLMEALANQAHSAILNHCLMGQLAQARDMEVMGKVSAFIVHDLKNLVYTLTLIVDNAKRYIRNPEFQKDMLTGLENTVSRMHVLISQLRQLPSRENLRLEPTDLARLARDAIGHSPHKRLVFRGEPVLALADRLQVQKVVLNLALNALEAGEVGEVAIETGQDRTAFLRVRDQGAGMSEAFMRECLFQPFKSTKSKGMGVGLYQCQQIVKAHDGVIEVESREGAGSVFTVRLPLAAAPTAGEDA